jgi:hypothetical protein
VPATALPTDAHRRAQSAAAASTGGVKPTRPPPGVCGCSVRVRVRVGAYRHASLCADPSKSQYGQAPRDSFLRQLDEERQLAQQQQQQVHSYSMSERGDRQQQQQQQQQQHPFTQSERSGLQRQASRPNLNLAMAMVDTAAANAAAVSVHSATAVSSVGAHSTGAAGSADAVPRYVESINRPLAAVVARAQMSVALSPRGVVGQPASPATHATTSPQATQWTGSPNAPVTSHVTPPQSQWAPVAPVSARARPVDARRIAQSRDDSDVTYNVSVPVTLCAAFG